MKPSAIRLQRCSGRFGPLALGIALACSAGCREDAPSSEHDRAAGARSAAPSSAASIRSSKPPPVSRTASTLLEWPESAYGTQILIEGSSVLVLTPTAAIRVTEGTPPRSTRVPFGANAAPMTDSIAYWREGALRAVPKDGGEPRTLGSLARPPQRLFASENRLAWLDQAEDGTYSLQTLAGKTPRLLHRTRDHVAAATLLGDRLLFVERGADGSWRLGAVSTGPNGAPAVFSRSHRGRTPSMLVAAPDGVYLYDGPTRSVRRWSAGLERETVIAENVICSPLAVAVPERVVCGHAEGVFEIPGKGKPPRVLAPENAGPIAAVAADERRAVWLVDSGENRFALRALALPPQ